jgi:hypothetical protein
MDGCKVKEEIYPFTANIKNHDGKSVTIYIDPNKKELDKLDFMDGVRALLDVKNCYAWANAFHATIMRQLSLSNAIPVLLFYDNQTEIYVMVTDASRSTLWHENPKVAVAIRNHPYIRKWKKIEIGYYNEDIVGDWEKAKTFKEWLHTNHAELGRRYPKIRGSSDLVDGRRVSGNVDNTSSIGASLTNWVAMSGIRRIPASDFEDWNSGYFPDCRADEQQKVKELVAQIQKSNRISPLIVVIDAKGPYVLEGVHRYDALKILKANWVPALIVIDQDEVEI